MSGDLVMRLLNILCSFSNTGGIRARPTKELRNERISLYVDSKT